MLTRLVSLAYHFPGMTPREVWALTFEEWLYFATASDWFDEAAAKAKNQSATHPQARIR